MRAYSETILVSTGIWKLMNNWKNRNSVMQEPQVECPNCKQEWSWDKYKCFNCGYITDLPENLLNCTMSLFNPNLQEPVKIYFDNKLIPKSPGIYAWYSDVYIGGSGLPAQIRLGSNSNNNEDWCLFYIGIAGEKKGRTLRDRIYKEHLNQNSKGSTVRQSLAALLWQDIGLNPKKKLNGEEEKKKLNNWIFHHARVAWVVTENPVKLEKLMLREFGERLRLNIKNNKANPFLKDLKKLRKLW
jgi:GIY-YIG catalytic domain-containing protein